MAEERSESREVTWRQLLPWTELFRAFQVSLDLNKLLLAAAGIFVTWFGWWLLAGIFAALYTGPDTNLPREWSAMPGRDEPGKRQEVWAQFRRDRQRWNL